MTGKSDGDKISELRQIRKTDSTLTNKQQCDPEDSKERIIQRTEKPKEAVKKEGTSEVVLDRREGGFRKRELFPKLSFLRKLKFESLILAQDERWRRA